MNLEAVSRSTIVFVMLLAMSVSVSPVAWAQMGPSPDSSSMDRVTAVDDADDIDVDLPPARAPKAPIDWERIFSPTPTPTPTPYKSPDRMVPPTM